MMCLHLAPPSRRGSGLTVALLAAWAMVGLGPVCLEAQKPMSDHPPPGIASAPPKGALDSSAKVGIFGATSNKATNQVAGGPLVGQAAKETLYSTDANTDLLERAIERFNREKCPPQVPITDINRRTLLLLSELQFIPSDISPFEKMVLRHGKVFKPVEQKPPASQLPAPVFPTGKPPDSLLGVLDVVAEGLTDKSPKGAGSPPPPKDIRLEERRGTFRNAAGELVEFKYWVPRVPGQPPKKFGGKIQRVPTDTVQKTLLPPKYNVTPATDKVPSTPTGQ
jgi:hypothetical protein